MSADHDSAREGDLTAAEYALGVLGAAERRDVQRRLAHETALAEEVASWEQRLVGLASGVAAVEPPLSVWDRIDAAIRSAPERVRPGIWRSLSFWRMATFASASLAAASLAAMAFIAVTPSRAPLSATLEANGQAGFVAAMDSDQNSLTIVPVAALNSEQRMLELWVIAPGDRPRSLGLIRPDRAIRVSLPPSVLGRVAPDAVLAITLEPAGGSPTGLPTGPVVANGKLTAL